MSLLGTIGHWFGSLGHAIGSLFGAAVDTETGLFSAYFAMKDDVSAFVANLSQFENFTFDPKWKTRVINVPRAIEGFQELFDILRHGLVDKFTELAHAIETVANVIEGKTGPPDDGPSGIANVQEKLATIKLAATNLQEAFHTALEIETTLLDIKNRVATLDDLFLPQGSSKTAGDYHYRKRNA